MKSALTTSSHATSVRWWSISRAFAAIVCSALVSFLGLTSPASTVKPTSMAATVEQKAAPSSGVMQPSRLVSWYRDENDVVDFQSPNNRTLENGITFAAGKVGQAFSLDSTADATVKVGAPCVSGEETWDGGGTTNNWSEATNWSCNQVPTSSDIAIFDGTSTKDATIDTGIDVRAININTGYTGTIAVANGVTATFNGQAGISSSQSSGTFTNGNGTVNFSLFFNLNGGIFNAGSGTINFGRNYTQTGGTFNGASGNVNTAAFAPLSLIGGTFNAPSGTLTVVAEFNLNGASFSHNNGTVVFTGVNTTWSITPSDLILRNLTINKSDGSGVSIQEPGRTVHVTGTLRLTEGKINANPGPPPSIVKAEGAVIIDSTFGDQTGTSVGGNGTLLIQGGAPAITIPPGASLPHITINDPGATITSNLPGLIRTGKINLQRGTVNIGPTDIAVGFGAQGNNSYNQSGGSFSMGSGNFSTTDGPFLLSQPDNGNPSTFSMTSGNFSTPEFRDIQITGGTFTAPSGTTTIGAPGGVNTNFTQSGGVFDANLHHGTVDMNARFTLTGGEFRATSGNTLFGFIFDHQGGTFLHNNGTVIFDSTHPGTPFLNAPGTAGTDTFNNVVVDTNGGIDLNGGGGDSFVTNGTLRIINGLVISFGNAGELQLKGDFIVESGADGGNGKITFTGSANQTYTNTGGANPTGPWTIDKPSGTVTASSSIILGTSQAVNITNGTLYLNNNSNLTCGALTIGAGGRLANDSATSISLGGTVSNSGRIDLQGGGAACPQADDIRIRSSVDGTQRNWSVSGQGSFRLVDVDVKDMAGTAPITVFSGSGAMGANNGANWTFLDNRCPPGLSISPLTAGVTVGNTQQFTAGGGFPPYSFTIVSNPMRGSINASSGLYTAISIGSDTVRVTDAFGNSAEAVANVFGVPHHLAFTIQPSNTAAGQSINPAVGVVIQDQSNNTVGNAINAVTIAIGNNPGCPTNCGSLSGTLTLNAVNGFVTFNNLSIQRAAVGYTLQAISTGLTSAISAAFDVVTGPAARVGFVTQPTDTAALATMTPAVQVAIQDAFGNTVPVATGSISLSLQNNPGNDQLFGTRVASPANGIASFNNLVSNAPANGYTLRAHRSGLTDEISNPYNITRPIWLVTNTSSSGAGSLKQAILDANVVTGSDTINFNITGTGPFTIQPVVGLPEITGPVMLDATSQPGYSGSPIVELRGPSAVSGLTGLRVSGGGSTIKGLAINSWGNGIQLVSNGGNTIQGNYIGVDIAGSNALGNNTGIFVNSHGNQIGGATMVARNVISGNLISGVTLASTNLTVIKGNYLGLNAAGTTGLPNQTGIQVTGNTSNSSIGGLSPGEPNLINYSSRGVHFRFVGAASGNSLRGNLIHLKFPAYTVIDLDPDNRNPNDPGDADAGGNNRQNFPVISSAIVNSNTTTVQGTLNSTPSSSFSIDLYSYLFSPSEGRWLPTYLGSTNATTDASGIASFQASLPQLTINDVIAATATDSQGNTSELSDLKLVVPQAVSISGHIIRNTGPALSNVRLDVTGGQTAFTSTDSNGNYSFNELPGGLNYIVTPAQLNYSFSPASRNYFNPASNQVNQNYTGTKVRSNIVGTLTQTTPVGNLPVFGATVTLSGPNPRTTTGNGFYVFTNLPTGEYTVTPEKNGVVFSPSSFIVSLGTTDQAVNFTGQAGAPLPGRFVFGLENGSGGQPRSMNADGTAYVRLPDQSAPAPNTSSAFRNTASLSRDGKRLVGKNQSNVLSVSNADGSNHRSLNNCYLGQSNDYDYEFSPDGSKIAYVAFDGSMRIVNSDGSGVTTLSLPGNLNFKASPTWLSNSRIAFSAQNNGLHVYAVNIDSTGFIQIASGSPDKFYPVASPNGSKIAFATVGSPFGSLHTMNADGSGDTLISSSLAYQFRFAWSPDGTRICFSKGRTTSPNTYDFVAVNASNGGELRVILNREVFAPSWGPLYEFATPPGSNVTVNTGFTSITFGAVTSSGTTTVTQIPVNNTAALPGNFQLAGGAIGYEISTTASYTPPITVCFVVPSTTAPTQEAFGLLSLVHSENGVFVDTTISRNFSTRTICGSVNSLSPFALAVQVNANLPSIQGLVQDSTGNPLPDVSVQLTGAETRTTQTDAFGAFSFVNLTQGGNYNVQPKLNGYLFTEYSQDYVNLLGENIIVFTGTPGAFSISGRVLDENGDGVSGAEISLNGSTTATTDKNGDYIFTDLPADGSFFLTPFKDGFGFSPVIQVIDPLTSDQTEVDFVLGPPACAFGTSTASRFFLMNGGSGSINVATGSSCSWTAVASDSWITIVSADTGAGDGVVDFEVRENFTNSARQATINISGQLLTIVQDGGLGDDCGYSISPGSQSFSAAGGGGVINVNAEDRCAWQAVSSAPWVTITLNDVGIGIGSVSYSVETNAGPGGRAATITIGGKVFAVKQKGP